MPPDKNTILQLLTEHSSQLSAYGVLQIGLFGSYLSDNATDASDIDLLVNIEKDKKTFRNFMQLNYYLEKLLGKKVDLITTQSLSPHIGPHILNSVAYASI